MRKQVYILILLSIMGHAMLQAQDWPFFRGPSRNGVTTWGQWDIHERDSATVRWTAEIGYGYGGVTVQGRRLYAIGNLRDSLDRIICLDLDTGTEIWRFDYLCPIPNGCFTTFKGPRATPAWDQGRLYTLSHQGQLFCLDAETGQVIWRRHLVNDFDAQRPKYGFSGSPVIAGGLLLLNARESGLALDKRTGRIKWNSPKGKASYSTPVVFDYRGSATIMLFSRKKIVCRNLATGRERWRHPWPYVNNDGAAEVDPVVVGESVFVSSGYRKGGAVIDFADDTPRERWFDPEIRTEFGTALYRNGSLFAPHGDTRRATAYLKCVDFKTGRVHWSLDTGHCSLIQVDGHFVLLNQWGLLRLLKADRQGHKILTTLQIFPSTREARCWTAPSFAHGYILIRRSDGRLACINFSKPVTAQSSMTSQ